LRDYVTWRDVPGESPGGREGRARRHFGRRVRPFSIIVFPDDGTPDRVVSDARLAEQAAGGHHPGGEPQAGGVKAADRRTNSDGRSGRRSGRASG